MTENIRGKIWIPDSAEIEKEKAFILSEVEELGEELLLNLVARAAENLPYGYRPYSKYPVSAALYTTDRKIYTGANYENAGYSLTVHAEGAALVGALNDKIIQRVGPNFVKALAISHPEKSAPCGECRQRLLEHTPNCLIIDSDPEGNIRSISSLNSLFPLAFGPNHLGK